MTHLVDAATLATLMNEIEAGQWTMSGQLSQISEACLAWKFAYPEQFGHVYDRFEKARQAVRVEASDEDWAELRLAASLLGKEFTVAV
jgi:hypothetical protein